MNGYNLGLKTFKIIVNFSCQLCQRALKLAAVIKCALEVAALQVSKVNHSNLRPIVNDDHH